MPRKQRFKPSRKPKPAIIPTPELPQEAVEVGSSSPPPRSPVDDRPDAAMEDLIPPPREPSSQAEAR